MSAFALAVDVLFGDASIGVDARYQSGGVGVEKLVRAVRRAPDTIADFNGGRFVADSIFIDIRVSDVAELEAGDLIHIGADSFEVLGDPVRDAERLVWRAVCREI